MPNAAYGKLFLKYSYPILSYPIFIVKQLSERNWNNNGKENFKKTRKKSYEKGEMQVMTAYRVGQKNCTRFSLQ